MAQPYQKLRIKGLRSANDDCSVSDSLQECPTADRATKVLGPGIIAGEAGGLRLLRNMAARKTAGDGRKSAPQHGRERERQRAVARFGDGGVYEGAEALAL